MPKKVKTLSINLLPGREPTFGEKFITWSLTFGRYIIIGTEIIVLLAFLSRFKLDRDLIDLNDQVKEKQKVLASLKPIEENVNQLQARLGEIKKVDSSQGKGILALPTLASLTPEGITYKTISVLADKITIIGFAKETADIALFTTKLKEATLFKKDSITLESVGRGKEEETAIRFVLSAIIEKGEK